MRTSALCPDFESEWDETAGLFSQKPVVLLVIVGFLFITAFGLRLYHIDEPFLDYVPVRQYRSAIIARGYYFESTESIPEWRREVASLNKEAEGILEPPIMELIASFAYRVVGGERLWIPRVLSSVFWLVGGVFLYLIAKRVASAEAAVISAAFYLFLPFGVNASRGFLPDPMMVMMLLWSIFMILRYYEQPSMLRLAIAAGVSAGAMFIKPFCLFPILGVFLSLGVWKRGIWRSAMSPHFLIFAVVSLLPAFIYHLYGIFIAGFLEDQLKYSFRPHLLLCAFYWRGWLEMVYRVLSYPLSVVSDVGTIWLRVVGSVVAYGALVGAPLGALMFRKGMPRALAIGLWAGYFVFGLIFNFHIYTHDYYQLQFIPVVALSLGPVCAVVMNRVVQAWRRWQWRVVAWSTVIVAIVFVSGYTEWQLKYTDQVDFRREVGIAQEVGEIVGHSTNTVFLATQCGSPLRYHGELSGQEWPQRLALGLAGAPELDAEERFEDEYSKYLPEYFVVTDLRDFEEQGDLVEFLTSNFPVMFQNDDYLVFDLRERIH